MSLPNFEGWAVFASVADAGSFSGAAIELGLSKATVSKAITRLEGGLGVSLFHRTSRRLALTGSGAGLIEQARAILASGRQAEECGREGALAPTGTVRLAAPMSFGIAHLGEPLARFLAAYPQVTVDLCLSDARVDLVADGFDAALRIGQLTDSSLIARKLCDVELLIVAGTSWIAAHGEPRNPGDLDPRQAFFLRQWPRSTGCAADRAGGRGGAASRRTAPRQQCRCYAGQSCRRDRRRAGSGFHRQTRFGRWAVRAHSDRMARAARSPVSGHSTRSPASAARHGVARFPH